ncbi:MAG TPA: hypothetical protein VFP91_00540 [Vicinamibacterales bacterium]|nr:hypothetical protein [Vicinamibacterales bacterium]
MTSPHPPRLATWVLERFCADPGLAGDLIEEYARRQSARWYWKQAVMAVGAYSTSQIMEHKWLAARAIATGYVIWYVFNWTLLKGFVRPWLDPDTTLEKAAFLAVGYSIWMANGWTIAKLHRPYSTAMVFAYVIWSIVASVPPVYDVLVSTVTGSTDGSALAQVLIMRTVTIIALMTGGALAAYRDQLKRRAQDWRQDSPRAIAAR